MIPISMYFERAEVLQNVNPSISAFWDVYRTWLPEKLDCVQRLHLEREIALGLQTILLLLETVKARWSVASSFNITVAFLKHEREKMRIYNF